MNDKTIIKTISKIYFTITSFLLFIFLTLLVTFVILQNGLYINDISLPNLKIKQLYIKWNEKLDISLKECVIKTNSEPDSRLEYKEIVQTLDYLSYLHKLLERIAVEKIIYEDITASFNFLEDKGGYFNASSPSLSMKSLLHYEDGILNIKIEKLHDKKRKIKINGDIALSDDNKDATASIYLNVNEDVSLRLLAYANKEKLFYKVKQQEDIKSITYAMELLNLHKDVKYWAYEAIYFSSVSIDSIYGWADFKDLSNAYKNIYAKATGNDLTYKYNKNLDAVHSKYTTVEFKNGVLYINPELPSSYNSDLGKSRLNIDFTKKEEILTLHLLFDGKLDKETLEVLKQYEIDVPFLQNSGTTKTDLTITVNLRTIDVSAKGDFFSKKANFRYKGFDIDVFDAYIMLDNYDIKINNMIAKYNDIATTKVDVKYNAKQKSGIIDVDAKKIEFKDSNISLNTKKAPLKIKYVLSKEQDEIEIAKSLWSINNFPLDIDKISLPFNLDTLKLDIPPTLISSPKKLAAMISGSADLQKLKLALDIDVQKLRFNNIEIMQTHTPLSLTYDKGLAVESKKTIKFNIDSATSYLGKSIAEIKNNTVKIKDLYLNIDNKLKTQLSFEYNLKNNSGQINTKYIRLQKDASEPIYTNPNKTNFKISTKDDSIALDSKDLELNMLYKDDIWKVDIDSISPIAKNSKFLSNYRINNGKISFYKKKDERYIHFHSKLKYPHKILVKDDAEIENYTIKGSIQSQTKKISLNINEIVDINIDKDVDISMKNIGLNVNAITDIIKDINKDTQATSSANVSIQSKDSYLYISKNRHIISDDMNLQYYDKVLTIQLNHKNGLADFKLEKDKFYAYGEDFNDEFMENLFSLSRFKDGKFSFRISGTLDKYDGIFTVDDTVIIDYRLLNNILAFVNTVPSLVTFALPGYSSKGLKSRTAYMKFSFENDIFNISDIYLDSKELDILGHGEVSLINNSVDLELNLKTDIGSKLSKVPVVGYLLMDKDSISTTLSITGALDEPKIRSLLAKDIVVAPLNILIRAISLPYYYLKKSDDNNTKEK